MLTDLCQLTMAYTYWKSGITGTDGCFHLYFRGNPFDGGYTVACGTEPTLWWFTIFPRDPLRAVFPRE
jgi:nicotinate phosphoribosyltransferase